MKKYFTMAALAVAVFAGAGEEYEFDKVSDWLPAKGVTQTGEGLVVKNRTMLMSKKLFDIVPGKIYKIKLDAKCLSGDKNLLCFGFQQYLANGRTPVLCQNVSAVPGTLCTVAKDAQKGDTVVYLDADAGKWKKYSHTYIALGAKKDFSDLPNYKTIAFPIKSIEKCEEGYKITLSAKLGKALAKGTSVRQHLTGGYMYAGGIRYLTPNGKEIELEGKVTDILPPGPGYYNSKWSHYAKKARLIVLVNWSGKGSVTELSDIELEIEDKK